MTAFVPKRTGKISVQPPNPNLQNLQNLGSVDSENIASVLDISPNTLNPNLQNLQNLGKGGSEGFEGSPTGDSAKKYLPTAWDLLRKDWKLLLESGFGPDDTVGSISVAAEVEGREIHWNQGVRLDRHRELAETVRGLRDRFPDPLEVRITAQHNGRHESRGKFTQEKARNI
jgi:hypothetical protein